MSALSIRQLEIFVQVVEIGSFRRCAEQIGVSQAAVSEHIYALENLLGVQLFDRAPGRIARITSEGQRAFARAHRILQELTELEWEFAPGRRGPARMRLTLAAQGYVLRDLQPELDRFRADHPAVDLVIRSEPIDLAGFRELLAEGEVDLVYLMVLDDPHQFPTQFVSYEHLAVYVTPTHPLADRDVVTAVDLSKYRAIKLGRHGHLRVAVDDALARVGLGQVQTDLETDDYGLILNTLQNTESFACMLRGSAVHPLPHLPMRELKLATPLPPLQLREAVSARGTRSAAVASLSRRIRDWQTGTQ
jgi:DNA-binding transcriptional LysR family regulator